MQRFKASLVTAHCPENPEPLVRDDDGDYVLLQDVVDWLRTQRNDIPMTGEEAAKGLLYVANGIDS
jgi:hypothetical protein